MDLRSIIALVLFFALFVGTIVLYANAHKGENHFNPVRFITRVAMFGAMSTILYAVPVFKFSLPFFPSFLEIHFDEVPAFICGFAYGPLAGLAVVLVKTLVKLALVGSNTMLVGEACDLVLSSVYIFIAAFVYKKIRNLKGVAIGLSIATAVQVFVAMLSNVFVMIPFYMMVMNYPEALLLQLMQKAMPFITDVKWSYAVAAVLPFNLLKDALVIVITFIVYHYIHRFLRMKKA
jgi:riboflavin transporter FmnP